METTFFLLFLLLVSWLLCHIPRGEILFTLFMVYILVLTGCHMMRNVQDQVYGWLRKCEEL
jgi:hypothetical protein